MDQRPVYLDLTKIRLPMSAFSSITHRLSGMYVFFITLPVMLYMIYHSTSSKSNFENLLITLDAISFKSIFIYLSFLIFWYHILTGIRHLIMDFLHIGESLNGANYSAIFVLVFWLISSVSFMVYIFI
jgi:succinate dehydrogenase / fumarate reductase cytochrome b subunit